MFREYTSIHDSHCCKRHGCKYGDLDCPVEKGDELGVKCESCTWDDNDSLANEMRNKLIKLVEPMIKDIEAMPGGTESIVEAMRKFKLSDHNYE